MTLCRSRGEPKAQRAKRTARKATERMLLKAPCCMRHAQTHRPIASVWRARLSIALMPEYSGLQRQEKNMGAFS